jgi:hypothetical protein
MSDLRSTIRNFLLTHAQSFLWPVVVYDANNRPQAEVFLFDSSLPSNPLIRSLDVDEISSQFVSDTDNGRYRNRKKSSWTWQMNVAFSREVDVNSFEKSLSSPVLFIPSAETSGNGQVSFLLTRTTVTHPPRANPATGTSVTFTIEIETSRL